MNGQGFGNFEDNEADRNLKFRLGNYGRKYCPHFDAKSHHIDGEYYDDGKEFSFY